MLYITKVKFLFFWMHTCISMLLYMCPLQSCINSHRVLSLFLNRTMAAAGVQQARHWMEGCAQAPSSRTHSCIQLGCHTEPCVNKAVSHLNTLKQQLSEEQKKRNREKEAGLVTPQRRASYLGVKGTESRIQTPKPLTETGVGATGSELGNVGKATMPAHGPKSSVLFRRSDLFVEGVGTGTVGERVLERGGGLALSPVEGQTHPDRGVCSSVWEY